MHEFIRTLATRLGSPGAAMRAQGIFDQAMHVGKYRWGRRAKLTSGAALAITLRESHKSDSIRDIAVSIPSFNSSLHRCLSCFRVHEHVLTCRCVSQYLLDEPPVAVSRAFTKVAELLHLGLAVADPAAHVPTLQAHLVSLLQGAEAGLPAQLTKVLSPLIPRLPSITRTATSLSSLVARTDLFTHLPTPPTACALFMLALEAELSTSLPNAAVLAQALGARLGAGKGAVMQRYKQAYDVVEEWIRDVPWLDVHERKTAKGRAGAGRSRVAKRVVVARGLKDVVQFQEEIWRKRIESGGRRPVVQLDADESASGDEWEGGEGDGSAASSEPAPPRKKAKTHHPRSVVDASQFLLNPLSASLPAVPASSSPPMATSSAGPPDLLTHLLTADASSLPPMFTQAPTRLQLLATERGGTDERHIADEELFTADELDGLMRSAEEAEAVRIAMGWSEAGMESAPARGEAGTSARKRKRGARGDGGDTTDTARGSKKINMDALARLLDPGADLAAEDFGAQLGSLEEYGEEEECSEVGSRATSVVHSYDHALGQPSTQDEEEVVEEWRPLSPGGGGGSAEDWYDF